MLNISYISVNINSPALQNMAIRDNVYKKLRFLIYLYEHIGYLCVHECLCMMLVIVVCCIYICKSKSISIIMFM